MFLLAVPSGAVPFLADDSLLGLSADTLSRGLTLNDLFLDRNHNSLSCGHVSFRASFFLRRRVNTGNVIPEEPMLAAARSLFAFTFKSIADVLVEHNTNIISLSVLKNN